MKIKLTEDYKTWARNILKDNNIKIDFDLDAVQEAEYLEELDYETGERGIRVSSCDIDNCPLEVIESSFTIVED